MSICCECLYYRFNPGCDFDYCTRLGKSIDEADKACNMFRLTKKHDCWECINSYIIHDNNPGALVKCRLGKVTSERKICGDFEE